MTIKEQLKEKYPTAEALQKARDNYDSWTHMAQELGITKWSLKDYRRYLGMKSEAPGKPKILHTDITHSVLDRNIKEMVGDESKNIVHKYKIVDPVAFFANPCGNDGLEYIGAEEGTTWRAVSHMIPSALREGRTV